MKLTARIHKEENNYVVTCQEVGTTSQGTTIEEALANLKEATKLYLEEFPTKEHIVRTFEVEDVDEDIILSEDDKVALEKARKEFKARKTTSLEDLKKELNL